MAQAHLVALAVARVVVVVVVARVIRQAQVQAKEIMAVRVAQPQARLLTEAVVAVAHQQLVQAVRHQV